MNTGEPDRGKILKQNMNEKTSAGMTNQSSPLITILFSFFTVSLKVSIPRRVCPGFLFGYQADG